MKKSLLCLPALLLIIFIIFSVMDRGNYIVERKMWKIQHQISVLAQQGELAHGIQYWVLANKCRHMILEYPQSSLLPQMYMQLAEIDVLRQDFDEARANYNLVLNRFPQEESICAKALVAIGETYLTQKKWDDAITFYETFIQEHPGNPLNDGLKRAVAYLQKLK